MIINLTQHPATFEQRSAGVRDFSERDLERLKHLLTIPEEILRAAYFSYENALNGKVEGILALIWPDLVSATGIRAQETLDLLSSGDQVGAWNRSREPLFQAMVAGDYDLTGRLVKRLKEVGVEPVYASSTRASEEKNDTIFKHLGFRRA